MEVTAYTAEGAEQAKPARLPAATFDGTVNEGVLHQVVTAVLARRRQGTASTKTRGEARGGGRKPWRQKGTGRARAGTIRSPLWRGGAVVFGPRPRSYAPRVPRKLNRLAIRSALNTRALDGSLSVVDPLEIEEPRTRTITDLLAAISATDKNVLILTDGPKPAVYLSARNVPRVAVQVWGTVSAYDVLWADRILVERTALETDAVTTDGAEGEES